MSVGERIRQERDRQMLTQNELGHRAGVASFTVSRIESGHVEPRYSTVKKIADALEVNPIYLWTGEEPTNRPLGEAPSPSHAQEDKAQRAEDEDIGALLAEEMEAETRERHAREVPKDMSIVSGEVVERPELMYIESLEEANEIARELWLAYVGVKHGVLDKERAFDRIVAASAPVLRRIEES
jgi:transcriptional regulator with XRE-family HTH domain